MCLVAGLLCPWGFCRQEYWSGFPCPLPGDFPSPGIKPRSSTLQADSLPSELSGKSMNTGVGSLSLLQGIFLTQGSPALQVDSLPAELPGKVEWDEIKKNLKCHAKFFVGSKEVLADFRVGELELGLSCNSEQMTWVTEIIWEADKTVQIRDNKEPQLRQLSD